MAKTKLCPKCQKNRILTQFSSARARICKPCQKSTRTTTSRKTHLSDTYDLTLEEYDALLKAQGGRCAICPLKPKYNLHVDHCHKTGIVRGLLCKTCNKRLLPSARDSVDRLQSAINYLNDPPAVRVIGERITPDMR